MRPLLLMGAVILVLGLLALLIPLPQRETHKAKIGDTTIAITTHTHKKLPWAAGAVLCVVGAALVIAEARKSG